MPSLELPLEKGAVDEREDISAAPESGQLTGAREDPWQDDEGAADHAWPSPHHASSKDEF